MRKKHIVAAILVGTTLSTAVFAQKANKERMPEHKTQKMEKCQKGHASMKGCDFTEEQREMMKTLKVETHQLTKPLKDELRELKAKQQTLMTADEPNMKAIEKNIRTMGELKIELEIIKASQKLKFRALLTDEQLMMLDTHKKGNKKGKEKKMH